MRQVPSIGRIVIYQDPNCMAGSESVPAIIQSVDQPGSPESSLTLVVFGAGGFRYCYTVEFDAGCASADTWSWPVHVPAVED